MDVDTFIGGHGDVAVRQDLLEYAQMHEDFLRAVRGGIAQGKSRDELADTIRMEQYSHYRNYPRMRGWVYALHHLLTTGEPMAAYPSAVSVRGSWDRTSACRRASSAT